jgi:hypothetical protein
MNTLRLTICCLLGTLSCYLERILSNITKDLLTDDVSEALRRIIDDTKLNNEDYYPVTSN